jgi:hypothetical protein
MRSKAASICANKIALSFDTLRNDKTVTKSQINSNPLSAERPVTKSKTRAERNRHNQNRRSPESSRREPRFRNQSQEVLSRFPASRAQLLPQRSDPTESQTQDLQPKKPTSSWQREG